MADLVREAMAMIEDMGEALSLSLDDSEEDEERERGDEGVSGLHEAPRSAGKRDASSRMRPLERTTSPGSGTGHRTQPKRHPHHHPS